MIAQIPPKPPWLEDEKEICKLLLWFWQKIDKLPGRRLSPTRKLSSDYFKQSEAGDRSWYLLNSLCPDVLDIRPSTSHNHFQPEWSGSRVSLPLSNHSIIQCWFGLEINENLVNWQSAVTDCIGRLSVKELSELGARVNCQFMEKNPLRYSGKDTGEVVLAVFRLIQQNLQSNTSGLLSLREMSARYFWGDSKFLDSKMEWLKSVFFDFQYITRKVEVSFYLPRQFKRVLFIENLDTYHQLITSQLPLVEETVLVYAAGFKLSASRIRNHDSAMLFQSVDSVGPVNIFKDWWFNAEETTFSVYFWGDFDFSGIGIFKALRHCFPDIKLWEPGYNAMLRQVNAGFGHSLTKGKKKGQIDPGETGCHYADEIILPELRLQMLAYDQEGIDFNHLV